MTTLIIPKQCITCKHLYNPDMVIVDNRYGCAAFPGGIPDAIYENEHDHRKPYPGDRGIRYERFQRISDGELKKGQE